MPYEYYFVPGRIVDGDTVDGMIDLGFSVHRKVRVRLAGIDTPEIRTRNPEEKVKGFAAKERMEQLIERSEKVVVKSLGVDKFGRCLGVLLRADDKNPEKWKNLNQTLLEEGHAKEYHGGKRP